MRFASSLFTFLVGLGGLGLLILGILDSSYLFAPWGNDLLLIALTALHPHLWNMLYYSLMSTIGSVLGCLVVDLTLRPLGEKGLERHLSKGRLSRIRKSVSQEAGKALAVASLAPPPFPFTPFIMAAAALQYPRKRLLGIVGVTRFLRFTVFGALAMRFGESILKWSKIPIVQGFLIGLIVVCTVGSVVSVYGWIERSRRATFMHHA